MEKIKQNTLAEATTELGFCKATNTKLVQEKEIDGQKVEVAGISPNTMATLLSSTFKTPGEKITTSEGTELNGVVQNYNAAVTTEEAEETAKEPAVEEPTETETKESEEPTDTEESAEPTTDEDSDAEKEAEEV